STVTTCPASLCGASAHGNIRLLPPWRRAKYLPYGAPRSYYWSVTENKMDCHHLPRVFVRGERAWQQLAISAPVAREASAPAQRPGAKRRGDGRSRAEGVSPVVNSNHSVKLLPLLPLLLQLPPVLHLLPCSFTHRAI